MPDMGQVVLILLGIFSTGFLGLLAYNAREYIGTQKGHSATMERMNGVQTNILVNLAAQQEQIRTLYSNYERHDSDIASLEGRIAVAPKRRS